jgi:hypothetical protein
MDVDRCSSTVVWWLSGDNGVSSIGWKAVVIKSGSLLEVPGESRCRCHLQVSYPS